MLTVNDDEFWKGVTPVEFGSLPALQDAVTVVGYPIGGDTISVTSGVVSRMEILSYAHGSTELLGLQVIELGFYYFLDYLTCQPVDIIDMSHFCAAFADRCSYKLGKFWWACF